MSNEITQFIVKPSTATETFKLCEMISTSSFCPSSMRGKPGDVLLALQMGSEVKLSYMQALQGIAVINGKPCLYGDAALAVAMSNGAYEYHKEWEEGSIEEGNLTAYCLVKRKGGQEHIKSFSMNDAKKASLWGKSGPWSQYPARMLQMRARAFAIRDQFADALRGIQLAEEVSDYQILDKSKPKHELPKKEHQTFHVEPQEPVLIERNEEMLNIQLADIKSSTSIEILKRRFDEAKECFKGDREALQLIVDAKDFAKHHIDNIESEDGA